jgi:meiotically up-regulated gene 157 (Mug157) protein
MDASFQNFPVPRTRKEIQAVQLTEKWLNFLPAVLLSTITAVPLISPTPVDLQKIESVAVNFRSANPRVNEMFQVSFLDTLKQAVWTPEYNEDGSPRLNIDGTQFRSVYIKTGDIQAEWLRDASAQVRPYISWAGDDPDVQEMIRGVIAREAKDILLDAYANAFTIDYHVYERKFELDSLSYPVLLARSYWRQSRDATIFDGTFEKALNRLLEVMEAEREHARLSSYRSDKLTNHGQGNKVGFTGMIWSGFRPSDDGCYYHYNIPQEMMAVVALKEIGEIERTVYRDRVQAARADNLRDSILEGIRKYGLVHTQRFGQIYAYEVDGLGHYKLMDDANVPSLLSAPYIGFLDMSDASYQRTRRFIFSSYDPNFVNTHGFKGVGSEHTPHGWIWPLALVMEALTTNSTPEKKAVLEELMASDPQPLQPGSIWDHRLHESFNPIDPRQFTRQDFGWPNALFSEFLLGEGSAVNSAPFSSAAKAQQHGA